MTQRGFLGELELMVLLALMRLGDDAYGVPVARELREIRGRDVALGSIYAALERLESKGLVVSNLGEPTPERGGRARRYFRLTREGLKQVRETRQALMALWRRLPELKGGEA
jgi:DNA-binding PadR family transcriptional regulator